MSVREQSSVAPLSQDESRQGTAIESMKRTDPVIADGMSSVAGQEEMDDRMFEFAVLKPSHIRHMSKTYKKKSAMLEHLQWYFRPKNSYDPERVDYNALNILAEYQTYNLLFAAKELNLNERQTANILDLFWQLLEFNPDADEQTIEPEGDPNALHKDKRANDQIAYLGDDVISKEEENHKQLLKHKFTLYSQMIMAAVDHPDFATRISMEQARRVTKYAHETYFRHLRLYDFVLKNTKLCEVKRVIIPQASPNCGDALSKAMVLNVDMDTGNDSAGEKDSIVDSAEKSFVNDPMDEEDGVKCSAFRDESQKLVGSHSGTDAEGKDQNLATLIPGTQGTVDSVTDSDCDEMIKMSSLDHTAKKTINRVVKDWNSKIDEKLTSLNTNHDTSTMNTQKGKK